MWFVPLCPHYTQSLKCSVAAGSVASRRGREEQDFETPSCKLQTRLQTRPPREAEGEGARGRPGAGGPGVRCPGAGGGEVLGSVPREWKAEGEDFLGGRRPKGGVRKREYPPPPPCSMRVCAACPARQAAPAARGAGEGTGRRRRRGGVLLRPFLPLSYLERTISRSVSSVSDLWHSKPDYSSH